jgi:hypothetical protein
MLSQGSASLYPGLFSRLPPGDISACSGAKAQIHLLAFNVRAEARTLQTDPLPPVEFFRTCVARKLSSVTEIGGQDEEAAETSPVSEWLARRVSEGAGTLIMRGF